ncbi:MAG: hypothetical protein ACLP7P_19790 [Rhodomicrobium sp.]
MNPARSAKGFLDIADRTLRSLFSLRRAFLRIQSLYSGIPYTKLKLTRLIGIHLGQVLIIERGTRRILDEWSDGSNAARGTEQTGSRRAGANILAAIAELERNPKAFFHGGIRTLDLGGSHVHLYATPAYILAAKYDGPAIGKLERHIDAALRVSLAKTPALLYFTGGKSAGLQGIANRVALTIEKILLHANLPPHGKARRPIFAYAAIAALCLAGIATTGEAIYLRYPIWQDVKLDQVEPAGMDLAAATSAAAPPPLHFEAGEAGHAAQIAGPMPAQSPTRAPGWGMAAVPASAAPAQQLLAVQSSELLRWQMDRALMQPALSTDVKTETAPVSLVDNAVKSGLAQLAKFGQGSGAELNSLNRLEVSAQPFTKDLPGTAYPAAGSPQSTPVSVTDQGVKLGLFSTSGDGNSIFSPINNGMALGGTPAGNLASEGMGAAGGAIPNVAGATMPTLNQPLGSAGAAVRALGH